jgi:hypothetical protein
VTRVNHLPQHSDRPDGRRATAPLARLLLLLLALPVVLVLIIAGFAVVAVVIAIAAFLLLIAVIRSTIRGDTAPPTDESSPDVPPRPPIPAHDGEGRENVRVIRRE